MIRAIIATVVGMLMLITPALGHHWFKGKFIQVASEWTAQYAGPNGYGGYGSGPPPSPPLTLRPGEEWLDGKTTNNGNNGSCCNGQDCWEIEDSDWWHADGAYWVRRDGNIYAIPAGQAQPSESKAGKAAACITDKLLCFFVPLTY